ncbi:CoA transferase [Actinomadura sp. LD22]|uniref:CoA transferase n=1 Tax=Actinomadura physcomitrii TaxID=2650748 RepID=A0A6I4M1R7_9ACTN|nr:CoA transferase [Actinomadura physcomitrii]MVZ99887.1 CoA transferase [Actinomadura physcomitrii]
MTDRSATAAVPNEAGSLADIRVIEIGDQQGEYCGLTLAGLGAEVVRVEPPEGAGTRRIGPFAGDVADPERSLHFWAYNRGKKSVALDLGTREGTEAFGRLLGTADVLIDSTPPNHLAGIGLDSEELERRFPRLVTARITPFGEDGPWAGHRASDLVHLALGGPLLNCGYDPQPDGHYDLPPMAPQLNQAFHIAGEQVCFGVIAALIRRERTGRGQRLTCAVHEAVAKNTETDLMAWVVQRQPYYRQTARHAGPKVASNITLAYTKDGRWLNVLSIGARDRNLLKPFLERYGMGEDVPAAEVAAEVGTRGIPGTTASSSANVEIIQRFVRRFTFAELPWEEMQEAGLLCAPVRRPDENAVDPHWLARGTFAEIEHPEDGRTYTYPVSKWQATHSRWLHGNRAPRVGEHTREAMANAAPPSPAAAATASPRALQDGELLSVHKKPFALPGTKIFDFTWFLASAGGTRFLAALGADVIKVEWKAHPDTRGGGFPEGGREARRRATAPLTAPPTGPMSGQFNNKNPGKRGISLNVRHPKGREIAMDFIRRSDVVAEGFSPGVFERWGFGWDRLKELNPSIIYAQQSGMGAHGTYGRFRAIGPIAGSLSGLTHMGGLPEPALPTGWGYSYLDWLGAYSFAGAILSALYQREVTGQGQWIDASQTEVGIFTTAVPILDWSVNGRPFQRWGNRMPYANAAPQGVYRCAGTDRWIAITCADDRDWQALATVCGIDRDPRFETLAGRLQHHDELDRLIERWTVTRDRYAAMEELQRAGIAAGVAQTAEDRCENDPQLAHLAWLTEVPNPSIGTWPVAEVPFDLSETPPHAGGWIDKGAPVYGEHNYEVYGEVLGLTCAEVDALAEEGVI